MPSPDLAALLDLAARAGADAADVMLVERQSLSVRWRLGELEELERKEEQELGIRVLVGRRQALAATSRLELDEVGALLAELVESARHLPENPHAGLAEPDAVATGPWPDLDLVDPVEPGVDELMQAAALAEDAARAVPGVSNSHGAGAGWSTSRVRIAQSNGFGADWRRTVHRLGVSVLAGQGTAMERDHEHRAATHRADLPAPAAIGRRAGERTVRRLHPRKARTAGLPVVFDPRAGTSLVGHLLGAISGEAVARGASFLIGRLGEPVAAPSITLTEEPLRPRGLASRPVDVEGIRVTNRRLVDRGRLETWLLDLGTGRRLGLTSTGHAGRGPASLPAPQASNLRLEPGDVTPDALIADIEEGFYVTDLMGMGVNLVTGDYSRGAAGFWIERGRLAHPVSEVTIAGRLPDMLQRMQPADDLEIQGSVDVPTLRIDGMTVAGR